MAGTSSRYGRKHWLVERYLVLFHYSLICLRDLLICRLRTQCIITNFKFPLVSGILHSVNCSHTTNSAFVVVSSETMHYRKVIRFSFCDKSLRIGLNTYLALDYSEYLITPSKNCFSCPYVTSVNLAFSKYTLRPSAGNWRDQFSIDLFFFLSG